MSLPFFANPHETMGVAGVAGVADTDNLDEAAAAFTQCQGAHRFSVQ